MEPWAWLALFLIGFALLQAVVYRYFQRGGSSNDRPARAAHADAGRDAEGSTGDGRDVETPRMETPFDPGPPDDAAGDDADTVHCPHCGASNERDVVYTYCRRCAHPLQ